VPLFPVHTWLPLAHTEAPTAGSVILAGVLLKLGTYGFCRLSIPMFPDAAVALAPVVAVLAIIGIMYAALAAWVQRDVKKLVAYSSVSHLGFCMLGLFSLKLAGVTGGVVYMVNHGLSTGALFLVIGCIYERYHTRDIDEIGGLARRMPWMAFFLIVFTLSSIGLPGLNGFVGEFMVLLGAATSGSSGDGFSAGPLGYGYVIPAATGIILSAVYMLWMCQRVLFGPVKAPANTPDVSTGLSTDLTRREIGMLAPIAVACVVIGVYPKPMLTSINTAVAANVLVHRATAMHAGAGGSGDARRVSAAGLGWPGCATDGEGVGAGTGAHGGPGGGGAVRVGRRARGSAGASPSRTSSAGGSRSRTSSAEALPSRASSAGGSASRGWLGEASGGLADGRRLEGRR
ncbi:MAG: NuoM family protein, partial [Phycisphaerae bacterium]